MCKPQWPYHTDQGHCKNKNSHWYGGCSNSCYDADKMSLQTSILFSTAVICRHLEKSKIKTRMCNIYPILLLLQQLLSPTICGMKNNWYKKSSQSARQLYVRMSLNSPHNRVGEKSKGETWKKQIKVSMHTDRKAHTQRCSILVLKPPWKKLYRIVFIRTSY